MRAGELIGRPVVDGRGEHVGVVSGLECELTGPAAGHLPAPRVTALVVSRRLPGAFLGYRQDQGNRGPALLRWFVVRVLTRGTRTVPWSQVNVEADSIRVRG